MKNKKNKVKLIIVIIMSLVIITWNKSYSYEMNNNEVEEKEIERKEFAIYLETKQNSNKQESDYSTTETYPKQGYLLNTNKTKCYEYGSKEEVSNAVEQSISSGVIDGSIIVTSQKSIYCNIYFDKDEEKPEVNEFTLTGSNANETTLSDQSKYTHTTNVTYNVTWTNDDVAQICVSERQECNSWEQINGVTSKSGNIIVSTNEVPKTIYVYLKDKANNTSVEKSQIITLDTVNPSITIEEDTDKTTEDTIVVNVNVSDTSGIKSVTCKATKDTNEITGNYEGNTCTFSGLESGTEYTITGEATDGSGRKNTSNELKIRTLKIYKCEKGDLIDDPEKGKICVVKASSMGWFDSYGHGKCYRCYLFPDLYFHTREDAASICSGSITGNCVKGDYPYCTYNNHNRDSEVDGYIEWTGTQDECRDHIGNWYTTFTMWKCVEPYHNTSANGKLFTESGCRTQCQRTFTSSSATNCAFGCEDRMYYCESGWLTYFGEPCQSTYECYKSASNE